MFHYRDLPGVFLILIFLGYYLTFLLRVTIPSGGILRSILPEPVISSCIPFFNTERRC